MAKEFKSTTKELSLLLKKLSDEVPESSNAAEYSKYLQKALSNARTFDKSAPTYIDYVARGLKPKATALPPKEAKKEAKPKAKKATDDAPDGAAKKRKEAKPVDGDKVTKKAKST
jgi:hypothetical protein